MKKSTAILTATVSLAALAGCGSEAPQPAAVGNCQIGEGPLAFALGNRSNSPQVSADALLRTAAEKAVAYQSTVSMIDTGGAPALQFQGSLKLESNNDSARKQEQGHLVDTLLQAWGQTKAEAPEANPLEALNRAADANRAAGPGGTIVMVDSGIQTEGAFSHGTPGQLDADPQELASSLKSAGSIPDLRGMTVLFSGIGDSAAPQAPIDAATRANLRAQWAAIATAGGAACVHVDANPRSGAAATGLPRVTAIAVKEPIGVPAAGRPVVLRSEVSFKPNSDELVDAAAASSALENLARGVIASGTQILVTGTTASDGTEAGRLEVSTRRANRVKELLVGLGVPAAGIKTQGVGTNHPGHVQDLDANGNLLPGPAAMNRSVIISAA